MKDVLSAYLWTNGLFSEEIANSLSNEERQEWIRKSSVNDQAYFVLLFAHLERMIDANYEERIGDPTLATFVHRVNLIFEEDDTRQEVL